MKMVMIMNTYLANGVKTDPIKLLLGSMNTYLVSGVKTDLVRCANIICKK